MERDNLIVYNREQLLKLEECFKQSNKTSLEFYLIRSFLMSYPLFREMSSTFDQQEMEILYSKIRVKKYNKDHIILKRGDLHKNIYIVLYGSVYEVGQHVSKENSEESDKEQDNQAKKDKLKIDLSSVISKKGQKSVSISVLNNENQQFRRNKSSMIVNKYAEQNKQLRKSITHKIKVEKYFSETESPLDKLRRKIKDNLLSLFFKIRNRNVYKFLENQETQQQEQKAKTQPKFYQKQISQQFSRTLSREMWSFKQTENQKQIDNNDNDKNMNTTNNVQEDLKQNKYMIFERMKLQTLQQVINDNPDYVVRNVLSSTESIGMNEFLEEQVNDHFYIADQQSCVLVLQHSSYKEVVQYHHQQFQQKIITRLRMISIFQHLSDSELIELVNHIKIEDYQRHQLIYKQNQSINSFYVVFKGEVEVRLNILD